MICAALLCVSLASELPGAGERRNSLPFQKPLHPMNRFAHKHAKGEKTKVATKPGRHGRARSPGRGEVTRCPRRSVNSTSNACRSLPSNEFIGGGAVNWGAEKNRTVTCAELQTDKSDPHKTRKTQKTQRNHSGRLPWKPYQTDTEHRGSEAARSPERSSAWAGQPPWHCP